MNFDFSDQQKELAATLRRFLTEHCPLDVVSAMFAGGEDQAKKLWQGLADLGLLGAAIPETYDGAGAGYLELCVMAEELGRALCPVPFLSSVVMATELIKLGDDAIKAEWLPALASGKSIGVFARDDDPQQPVTIVNGVLRGCKAVVPDASNADVAVVAINALSASPLLALVDLRERGVTVRAVRALDRARPLAAIAFDDVPFRTLAGGDAARAALQFIDNCAAVVCAFEQLGGAERALEIARDYALERYAFGRPIGSFQALKHMLADMFVAVTMARSNAYWAAWALATHSDQLPAAAASARISATTAFELCSSDNIQVHGGMGFTWESHCHLFYRRANGLARILGRLSKWEDQLVYELQKRAVA